MISILRQGVIAVQESKCRSRVVPLHPSAIAPLRKYAARANKVFPARLLLFRQQLRRSPSVFDGRAALFENSRFNLDGLRTVDDLVCTISATHLPAAFCSSGAFAGLDKKTASTGCPATLAMSESPTPTGISRLLRSSSPPRRSGSSILHSSECARTLCSLASSFLLRPCRQTARPQSANYKRVSRHVPSVAELLP